MQLTLGRDPQPQMRVDCVKEVAFGFPTPRDWVWQGLVAWEGVAWRGGLEVGAGM
jgi:hypothetical protein